MARALHCLADNPQSRRKAEATRIRIGIVMTCDCRWMVVTGTRRNRAEQIVGKQTTGRPNSRTSRIREEIAAAATHQVERFEELTNGCCLAFTEFRGNDQIKGVKRLWTECW
jgi:hypothetical protein